jgi:hypothetical protein
MATATDRQPWLIHHETASDGTRIMMGLCSAIPLIVLYELVIRPGHVVWSLGGLPFLAVGAIAFAKAAQMLFGAIFCPEQRLWADPVNKVIINEGHLTTGHVLRRRIRFAAIKAVILTEDGFSDTDPQVTFQVKVRGRRYPRRLFSRSVKSRPVLDSDAHRLRAMIGLPVAG